MNYETIFNVFDGVIIVSNIDSRMDIETTAQDDMYDHINLSSLLGALWYKLHQKFNPHDPGRKQDLTDAKAQVRGIVKAAETSDPKLSVLKSGTLGCWLPYFGVKENPASQDDLEGDMGTWLNYIIMYVQPGRETYQVISSIMQMHDMHDIARFGWSAHQVYCIGQMLERSHKSNSPTN